MESTFSSAIRFVLHCFVLIRLSFSFVDDKETLKHLREEALNQIALKQKQQQEANATLLNTNKREAVREQMKVL